MGKALFAAALLVVPTAHAALPMPGYAARPSPPAPREDFLSSVKIFGGTEDPLDTLAVAGEDLRDSLASPMGVDGLQRGLRSSVEEDRLSAIRAASRPRDVEAVPYLAAKLLRLDESPRLRAAAALALGRIGDRVAVPSLAEALSDPSREVRYAAALAIGLLPADGVATRLGRVLRTDPAWQVRYAAAIALGRTRKGFTASSLALALKEDASWQVRQQSARSLQELPGEGAIEALCAALQDGEPSVRAAAGTALAAVGGPSQKRVVSEALSRERDPSVRAILALAARKGAATL